MILIVDDEATVRRSLTTILSTAGYQVRAVADGAAALGEIARCQPALIVTDLSMPGLDGCSLAGRLLLAGNNVPIVLMSQGLRESPLSTVRLLRKPIDGKQVLRLVADILAMGSSHRASNAGPHRGFNQARRHVPRPQSLAHLTGLAYRQ